MDIEFIKEDYVLFHPKKRRYVQIKEITRTRTYDDRKKVFYFVCSDWSEYFSDSQTNIGRQVLTKDEILDCFYIDPIGEN